MSSTKILFLEASGGGGHISITTSIIEALKKQNPDIGIIRKDVISPLAHKLYQAASRQFVNAYFLLYKATDNHRGELIASRLNRLISQEKLTKIILESKADLIFSNFALAINEVPKILEKEGLKAPFIVFVPDPFTIHNIYFSKKADLTIVSTLTAYQAALNSGIWQERLEIAGHPVREEFYNCPKNIKLLKQQLGLDPDMFTILFGGSGHGAEKTLEILIHLGAKKNMPTFQAICVCGDNTELKEELEMLNYPPFIKPKVYLKSEHIAQLVHASDLIVAKAGPNILFESIAAGKPFLATYHIKGQEDGNLDLIKCAQLGFCEENPQTAAFLIENILKNREILKETQAGISFVRQQHKEAAEKIAQCILKYLK